jgi:hypothetical protein
MPLIHEDGSGKPDAETYISITDADAYHLSHGNSAWSTIQEEQKRIYLRDATNYMVDNYRNLWKGHRTHSTQALDWPRTGIVIDKGRTIIANNMIPIEIKRACAELALRASIGTLVKDQSRKVASETVGPVKVVYERYANQQKVYKQVDMMLSPFLSVNSGLTVKLGRR